MDETQILEKKAKFKGHFFDTLGAGVTYLVLTVLISFFMDTPKDDGVLFVLFTFFLFCNFLGAWIYWAYLIGNYIVYDNPQIKPIYVGCISIPSGILMHYLSGPFIHKLLMISFDEKVPYDGLWRGLL